MSVHLPDGTRLDDLDSVQASSYRIYFHVPPIEAPEPLRSTCGHTFGHQAPDSDTPMCTYCGTPWAPTKEEQ